MKIKIYTLFSAAILAVLTMATICAYAAPSADLDQCRNGPKDAPVNCTGTAWVNGNVGAQQGHLAEGYSIPYRARMFEMPPNTQVSLVLEYDVKHSDHFALDYLTYFQRLDSPFGSHFITFGHSPETVDPTSGVTFTGPIDTFPIPAPSSAGTPVDDQPNSSFNNLTAGERLMTLYGGDITNISYVPPQANLTEKQSATQLRVNFTTNQTCPVDKGVQKCTAILSWGGHIAAQFDWGLDANGNPRSAAGISGSPYHMRLISWNLGNLGNQDRSLAAATVVAPSTIIIIKDTIPNGGQDFNFITTGGLSSFSLDDDADPTLSNNKSFGGLLAGTYSVTENATAGFKLTNLTCTGSTTTDLTTRTATIDLAQGATVTCTFENTQNASLTVIKDAVPNDAQDFNFTGSGAIGSFALDDDSDGTLFNNTTFSLEPGTFSVAETVPANWKLTSATCSNGDKVDSIDLVAGQSVICTFTNTKNATLTIVKDAIPNDPQDFNFTGDGAIGNFILDDDPADGTRANNVTFSLEPGAYNVSETVPIGWSLTDSYCSNGNEVDSINLGPGDSVTCTFENTKKGTIIVEKQTIPDGAAGSFTFTGTAAGTIFDNGTIMVTNLIPGQYTSTENATDGFVLTNISCDDVNSTGNLATRTATFNLEAGETVKCTFTNAKLHLSFIKEGALNFTTYKTDYLINVTNDGYANLTIVDIADETNGTLTCDPPFELFGLLPVGESIICHEPNTTIDAATIIEILDPHIFWRV